MYSITEGFSPNFITEGFSPNYTYQASRAAGVRLKKMRDSGFRCETGHSFIHVFIFGPVKPLET